MDKAFDANKLKVVLHLAFERKVIDKSFSKLRRSRSWEMFLKFPFFYWSNLGKTQIRLGHIFSKLVARTNIATECFFQFYGFFVDFYIPKISNYSGEKDNLDIFQNFHYRSFNNPNYGYPQFPGVPLKIAGH